MLIWGRGGFLHAQMHQWRFLMTMQSHADFFCSALKGQLNSSLFPISLPLNELRQGATTCLGLLRHLKRAWSSFFSVERRLFPCGSAGQQFKGLMSSFSPWQWRYPATVFVKVSGNNSAFEKSCTGLDEAYNFDKWVGRVSGVFFCIWKKGKINVRALSYLEK